MAGRAEALVEVHELLLRHGAGGGGTLGAAELRHLIQMLDHSDYWTEERFAALMAVLGLDSSGARLPFGDLVPRLGWPGEDGSSTYASKGALCAALGRGHTVLVRGEWFVEQHRRGGRLLRRQDMERDFPGALVSSLRPDDIWDMRFNEWGAIDTGTGGSWLLVAVSYPWLAKEHPDPHGSQLAELAHFIGKLADELGPNGKRVAVFLDYMSLYQEERTPQQRELFVEGLSSVNLWYGHQCVQVWALTHTAHETPYHHRGWTTFEWRIALLASFFVFDLGKVRDRSSPVLKHIFGKFFHLGSFASARAKAEPPVTPASFEGVVRQKVFTNAKGDLPFVQKKYRETAEAILGSVKELDFSEVAWSKQDVINFGADIVPMCARLLVLNLSRCTGVTDVGLGRVVEKCPELQELYLSGCTGVTDVGVGRVAEHCHNLRALALSKCPEVTDAAVCKAAESCCHLQELYLDACSRVTDVGVARVADSCPDLRRLFLSECAGVTDVAVGKVADGCRGLRWLNLSGCASVTDLAIGKVAEGCRELERLDLSRCTQVTDAAVGQVARSCRGLQRLHLGGCAGVTDAGVGLAAEGCRGLQWLYLPGCAGVTDVAIGQIAEMCPQLQRLDLSHCGVTDVAVAKVAAHSRGLQWLNVNGCTGVTDVGVQLVAEGCRGLQRLQLGGCTSVTDTAVLAVAERCDDLHQLGLRGCPAVTAGALEVLRRKRPECAVFH